MSKVGNDESAAMKTISAGIDKETVPHKLKATDLMD